MTEHLSLATCRALKAAGYPQDAWPQMVWRYEQIWEVAYQHLYNGELYFACPPIISANGTGGVLPWLEAEGYLWGRRDDDLWWFCKEADTEHAEGCKTPEALIVACLAALASRTPDPAPDGAP